MKIRFWGVRGSIPTPLSSNQIQRKISAVVQRIQTDDLKSPETREAFLATLPDNIFGTVGGNTTCVEVRLSDDTIIIFDAGSGLARLGTHLHHENNHIRDYHIFFTHFHWDHIQGLPFFSPQVFNPECRINFYSPIPEFKEILSGQMKPPYFPITIDMFSNNIHFNVLEGENIKIGKSKINWRRMKHPGGSFSYKIEENFKTMIFSTDTELQNSDFEKNNKNINFYKDTDLIILDTQYTLDEAIEKYDWGHSSYSLAVDFASAWNINKLVLFHHDPLYDDNKMDSIFKSANWYKKYQQNSNIEIMLAREDLEISL
ncbi:MAG: MBL fold metallo-hydrolase [Spirochaetia bacterium]|jgi:phosphoribosyl 1,2-cyclic phosphodiesterase|nr:MBL fold metallo-hydrolase [Spirochaetia bacterium]